jgi:hypothetical protein
MSDLRDYETPETGNTGQLAGAQETTASNMRAYQASEAETENSGQVAGAPETATSDMRGYQTPEDETGNTKGKIIGAVLVALMIGVAGAYTVATGMWNSPPKQVLASLVPPSTSLPSVVAPMQHAVVPQLAPDESAPAEMSPQAVAAPPVKAARTHVVAHATRHSPAVQPSENLSDRAFVPAAVSVPVQPAMQDTIIAPPAMTPLPDAPMQPVAAQPAETVPVQPVTQP